MAYRTTFQSPYEQYASRVGQPFKVLGKITRRNLSKQPDADQFDAEVLPIYRIVFDDGKMIYAWPEEIEED